MKTKKKNKGETVTGKCYVLGFSKSEIADWNLI
jgi:hypothetical protein